MTSTAEAVRPAAEVIYGIPRERVVGSGFGTDFVDGEVVYSSTLESFDDGPQKPLHIWARTGRRPAIACGNSNGDLEMLRFAGGAGKPALRLVVAHDDAEREVDDPGGADKVLDAETMPFVDGSAARMLEELAQDLRRDGVALVIARDVGQVRDVLRRTGADAPLVHVHRTIQDAVEAVLAAEVSPRD